MKNDELLHKWVSGTLTNEELEIFKLRPEYESLVELYENTERFIPPSVDQNKMLQNILQKEKEVSLPKKEEGRRVFLSRWMKYGVAASILLLIGWFALNLGNTGEQIVNYELAKAQTAEGTLPDGSTFVLNADSKLSYDANAWKTDRNLDLGGEAFFKVKKGSKFLVTTPNGSVQVLGTEFNVRSRKEFLEVKCKTGKVAVLSISGKVLEELTPNKAVRISGNQIVEKWQMQNTNSDWTNGMTRMNNVSVEAVLEELERQFDIEIISNNIDTKEIVSSNFQNKDLELALKTALGQLNVEYVIEDKKVILKK